MPTSIGILRRHSWNCFYYTRLILRYGQRFIAMLSTNQKMTRIAFLQLMKPLPGLVLVTLLFSSDGQKTVFAVQELNCVLEKYLTLRKEKLISDQCSLCLRHDFEGSVGAAECRISPVEARLCSNRAGANTFWYFQQMGNFGMDFERIQ